LIRASPGGPPRETAQTVTTENEGRTASCLPVQRTRPRSRSSDVLVPLAGVDPGCPVGHGGLSAACLPVPSQGRAALSRRPSWSFRPGAATGLVRRRGGRRRSRTPEPFPAPLVFKTSAHATGASPSMVFASGFVRQVGAPLGGSGACVVVRAMKSPPSACAGLTVGST
jgi:hypothetical protein